MADNQTPTTEPPVPAKTQVLTPGVTQFDIDTGVPRGLESDAELNNIVNELRTTTDPDIYNQLVALKQKKINHISSQMAITPGSPNYGKLPDTPETRANIEQAGKDISQARQDVVTLGKGGLDAFNHAKQRGLIPSDATFVPGETDAKKWGYLTKDQLQEITNNLVNIGAIKDAQQLKDITSDPDRAYKNLKNVQKDWQSSYDTALKNLDAYKSGENYDLLAAVKGGISHAQLETVFGKEAADQATAAKSEMDDFNAHNTKLPDRQYISNADLTSLKDADAEGYGVLTGKGFDAYQKYIEEHNANVEQANAASKADFDKQLKDSLDQIKANYEPSTANVLSNLFEEGARTGNYAKYDAAIDNIGKGVLLRETDFKQNNTRLPDGNWIANNDLEDIRKADPDGFKLLNEQGFDKFDAYVAQKNLDFSRFQTASPQGKLSILIGEGKAPVGATLAGVDKDGNVSYYPPPTQSVSAHAVDVTKPGPFGLLYFKSTGDIAKLIKPDDYKSLDKEFNAIPKDYQNQIVAEKIRNDVLHGNLKNSTLPPDINLYNKMSEADKKDVLATYLLEQSPDRLAQIQTRRSIILNATPIAGTAVYWKEMSTPWKVASVAGDALSLGLIDVGGIVRGIKNLPKVPGLVEVETAVKEGRQAELATLRATTTPKVVEARIVMFKDMDAYAKNLSEIEHFTSVAKEAPLAAGGRLTGYEKILGDLKAKTPELEGKLIHSGNEFQTLQTTTGAKGAPGAMHEALLSGGSAIEQVGKAGVDMPARFRLGQQTANQIQDAVKSVYSEAPSKLPDLIKQRNTLTGQIVKAQSGYKTVSGDLAKARNIGDIQTYSRKLGDVNRQISINQKLDFNRMLQVRAKLSELMQEQRTAIKEATDAATRNEAVKRFNFYRGAAKTNDSRIANFLKEDLGTEVHGVNPRDKWSGIWGGGSTAVKTKVINPDIKPLTPSMLRRMGATKMVGTAAKIAGGAVTERGRATTAYETPDQTKERLRREKEAGLMPEDVTSKQIERVRQKGVSPVIKPIIVPKPGQAPGKTPLKAPVVHPSTAPSIEPAKLPAKAPAKLPTKVPAVKPGVTIKPSISKAPTPAPSPAPAPAPSPAPKPVPEPLKVKAKPKEARKPSQPPKKERLARLPFPKMTEEQKREAIKKSGGAFTWQQGQLGGKPVWHVVVNPFRQQDQTFVLGKAPEGATVTSGKGQAKRSIRITRGEAPAKPVLLEGGAIDPLISPTGKRSVRISFIKDRNIRKAIHGIQGTGLRSQKRGRIFHTRIGRGTLLSRHPLSRKRR